MICLPGYFVSLVKLSKRILWEFDQNMQNMIVSKCILWEFDQKYAKRDSFIVYLLDFDRNMIVS